jgi:hypothetical protein
MAITLLVRVYYKYDILWIREVCSARENVEKDSAFSALNADFAISVDIRSI